MHPYGLSADVMLCGSSDFNAAPALPLGQAAKSVPNTLLPAKALLPKRLRFPPPHWTRLPKSAPQAATVMSDYICPFFADEEQSDSEEATSPRGSEYSFSLLFRGESASEPATPGARSPGALSDYVFGGGTPAATPRRSLFARDVDAAAKEPAARPWFATSTAQNIPPPKQKSTTQSVLEAVGLAAPEPEPEPKSRVRAVLESTGLVSPAPEPEEESASYF